MRSERTLLKGMIISIIGRVVNVRFPYAWPRHSPLRFIRRNWEFVHRYQTLGKDRIKAQPVMCPSQKLNNPTKSKS